MTTSTADESLQRYKQEMGDELGSYFHLCLQELYWASSVWDMHETLFQNPDTTNLMNDANGGVSFAIQIIFFEYVQLGLCRLTDPAKQNNSTNLTVGGFPDLVDVKLRPQVHQLVSDARKATNAARDWRNRKISHSDFHLKMASTTPLASTSRIATTEAIARIHRVFEMISYFYCGTDLGIVELGDNDAIEFLLHLFYGQQKKAMDAEAVKRGDYQSLENRFPDWIAKRTAIGSRYDLDRILKVPREH